MNFDWDEGLQSVGDSPWRSRIKTTVRRTISIFATVICDGVEANTDCDFAVGQTNRKACHEWPYRSGRQGRTHPPSVRGGVSVEIYGVDRGVDTRRNSQL